MSSIHDKLINDFHNQFGNLGSFDIDFDSDDICDLNDDTDDDIIDKMSSDQINRAIEYFSRSVDRITSASYSDGNFFDMTKGYKQVLERNGLWDDAYQKKFDEIERHYERMYALC